MLKKTTLLIAAGAGYVLGAKAGKERYAQIEGKFREIAGMPAVQSATASVKETAATVADSAKATAGDVADSAKATVNDKVEAISDKASSTKGGSGISSSKAPATAPMAGAAASGSAPDVPSA